MTFLLIVAFIGLILFEVPGLIRDKSWRELAVYTFLMSIAFMLSLLLTLNITVPNPVRDTQYFVKNLLHLSYE
ncbi:hypothetical protein [Desulfitobacterium metallireducens]|uniref:Uncharacterized protein n=1 Tax=Desulfitobacterium metallireducens DSM 15288 TaxID=871968 RepID=W0E6S2_9FIRM|nr:hypothetical protein [Desulfitobacterium metallireducens]AHF06467.1 hypothetical protein DESME_04880 [Desulfitobacterium metallireducens DSM 15288]